MLRSVLWRCVALPACCLGGCLRLWACLAPKTLQRPMAWPSHAHACMQGWPGGLAHFRRLSFLLTFFCSGAGAGGAHGDGVWDLQGGPKDPGDAGQVSLCCMASGS